MIKNNKSIKNIEKVNKLNLDLDQNLNRLKKTKIVVAKKIIVMVVMEVVAAVKNKALVIAIIVVDKVNMINKMIKNQIAV